MNESAHATQVSRIESLAKKKIKKQNTFSVKADARIVVKQPACSCNYNNFAGKAVQNAATTTTNSRQKTQHQR